MPGISGTLLCVPLPFDFDLNPSAIINHDCNRASQVALVVKNPPANAGDARSSSLIPGSGRSPGVGNGNPFRYSCLGNPMDRGAWWTPVHELQRVGHYWAHEHNKVAEFCESFLWITGPGGGVGYLLKLQQTSLDRIKCIFLWSQWTEFYPGFAKCLLQEVQSNEGRPVSSAQSSILANIPQGLAALYG